MNNAGPASNKAQVTVRVLLRKNKTAISTLLSKVWLGTFSVNEATSGVLLNR